MVLVDTSVWIRFLLDRPPHAQALDDLLEQRQVLAHELVYGEILIRERGGRLPLVESFKLLKWAMGIPHEEVVDFVRHHKLHGLGAGWVDVHLLASAVAGGHQLWTADPRLHELAKRFRVAYDVR